METSERVWHLKKISISLIKVNCQRFIAVVAINYVPIRLIISVTICTNCRVILLLIDFKFSQSLTVFSCINIFTISNSFGFILGRTSQNHPFHQNILWFRIIQHDSPVHVSFGHDNTVAIW